MTPETRTSADLRLASRRSGAGTGKNRNSILIDVGDVYQGTDVSLRTNGALIIDLFNHLKYDAWIVGNHEFDWGVETFMNALAKSEMPVLAANMHEKAGGEISANPFAKIQPYVLKEVDGIRIAIIGVTTPECRFGFGRNSFAASILNMRWNQSAAR